MLLTKTIKALTVWKDIKDTLEVPVYPGHVFSGWSLEGFDGAHIPIDHVFREDSTIYACYDTEFITITLDVAPGTAETTKVRVPALSTFSYVSTLLKEIEINYPGMVIDFWSLSKGSRPIDADYKFEKSTTIYANYTEDFITIVFDAMGGNLTGDESIRVKRGTTWNTIKEEYPNPERAGYTFLHWTLDVETDADIPDNQAFTEDYTTVYAVFEKIPVYIEITFNYDGFTETVTVEEGSILQEAIALLDGWNKGAGYTLLGWNISNFLTDVLDPLTYILHGQQSFNAIYRKDYELYLITNRTLLSVYDIPETFIGNVSCIGTGETIDMIFGNGLFNTLLKHDYIQCFTKLQTSSGTPLDGDDLPPGKYYIAYPEKDDTRLAMVLPGVSTSRMSLDDYIADDRPTIYFPIEVVLPFVCTVATMKSKISSAISKFLSDAIGFDEIAPQGFSSDFDIIGLHVEDKTLNDSYYNYRSRYISFNTKGSYITQNLANFGSLYVACRYRSSVLLNQAPGNNKLLCSGMEYPYCTLRVMKEAMSSVAAVGTSGKFYVKTANTDFTDRSDEVNLDTGAYDVGADDSSEFFPTLDSSSMRAFSYHE